MGEQILSKKNQNGVFIMQIKNVINILIWMTEYIRQYT